MTWDLPTGKWGSTQINAGFGVFGGGDPTVHFANAYQNFGGAIGFGDNATFSEEGDICVNEDEGCEEEE